MYFEKKGKENTNDTIKLAIEEAEKRGIKHIVVASNTGETAELLKDVKQNVVVVTHAYGYAGPGKIEMESEEREKLIGYGFKVCTTTHVLSGAERGISKVYGGSYPLEIMANTLRMLGQGVKVTVEISTMALDSGLIPYGEDIIAIAGSGIGADTAVIIRPAYAAAILETKIKEIICKPYKF